MREHDVPPEDGWASDVLRAETLLQGEQERPTFSRVLRGLGAAAVLLALFVAGLAAGADVGDRVVTARAVAFQSRGSAVETEVEPGPPGVRLGDPLPVVATGAPRFDERVCPAGARAHVRCGYLDVPESRSASDGRRVRIAVSIREADPDARAPGAPRRAVVVLSGGPGVPLLPAALIYQDGRALGARDVDVVVIDQRGSGRSVPTLACPGVGIGSSEPLPTDREGYVACAVRNLLLDIDPLAFSTRESAADVADLRLALEYDELDLVGISYGSRLALAVVRDHPEVVRSIVLNGVYPPNAPDLLVPLELARVVIELADVCDRQPGCRDAFGPLEPLLLSAMARAEEDGGLDLVTMLTDELFFSAYWVDGLVTVPRALAAAAGGDWEAVRRTLPDLPDLPDLPTRYGVLLQGSVPASGPRDGQESLGLSMTVNCSDSDGRFVVDPADPPLRGRLAAGGAAPALLELTDRPDPIVGGGSGSSCRLYGISTPIAEPRSAVESDVPALVLSGRFDPTTPPRHGELAARTLPRSHVVVAPHLAHGLITVDDCVDGIVAEFLARPDTMPSVACLDTMPLPVIALP